MTVLWLDLETRSETPIDVGVFRYAESAEITLCSTAVDDGEPVVAEWTGEYAERVRGMIEGADRVVCHNTEFDCTILAYHTVDVPLAKRYCTMAQARRHGLPGGLEKLSEVFRLPVDQSKMKDGKALVRLFCKPQKDGTWATRATHPAEWARFADYARLDVIAMRELHKRMPKWNDEIERPVWELDQVINARGFAVDTKFAWHAVQALAENKGDLDESMAAATGGAVSKGSQRDRILKYLLAEYGVDLPDLTASTLDRRLNDLTLPDGLRQVLAIRDQSRRTSTSKYATLLKCVNADDRLRGTMVYCGAGRTGRWSGSKFQPHNLPRPTLPPEEIDYGIRLVKAGGGGLYDAGLGTLAASAVRGAVVAAPGHRLVVADLANIEGRVVAWLAGEQWKLDAFRAYDAGSGPDLYRLAYARAFGVADPASVGGVGRQIGKVLELFMGFGGGVGAFITGAENNRMDLEDMAKQAWPAIPRDVQIEAEQAWHWAEEKGKTFDLPHDVYVACDALKRLWRREHPNIARLWEDLEDAARMAIQGCGEQRAGMLHVDMFGSWLRVKLPSGRYLCYPGAKVDETGALSFMGQSPYSRTWARQKTWGGTLVENATQATARDVLAAGLLRAEAIGLRPVLHVHDEIICEANVPAMLLEIEMTTGENWMAGLPLAAKGFECERYRKGD